VTVGQEVAASFELHETSSAIVLLAGDRAYKIKKPVDLGFLDFRTAAARRDAVQRELVLNRRLAPDVYLDAATLQGSDGTVLEHVLVMRRMPDKRRVSHLVAEGALEHRHLDEIARLLVGFHATAARSADISNEAGAVGLRRRWTDNLRETLRFADGGATATVHRRVGELALGYVDGRGPLFAQRAADGRYVDGHADLTADDVYLLDDGPRVLDCLEFDDRLRSIDVLDDVAFLAMDLERLGRPDLGRRLLDRYAEFGGAVPVVSLEHHYLAYRAFVRAKIAWLRAEAGEPGAPDLVERYLTMTMRHLLAGEPTLVLVGGSPGTGKTTVASRLADRMGAVLLSTDRVRAELRLSAQYDERSKAAVYEALLGRAEQALAHGESVIADATWGTVAGRVPAHTRAERTHSRLVELECHAPQALAADRAQRRFELGTNASAADAAVANRLAELREPWPTAVAVDTSGSPEEALRGITHVLDRARGELLTPA
jgi:hypothetical protein